MERNLYTIYVPTVCNILRKHSNFPHPRVLRVGLEFVKTGIVSLSFQFITAFRNAARRSLYEHIKCGLYPNKEGCKAFPNFLIENIEQHRFNAQSISPEWKLPMSFPSIHLPCLQNVALHRPYLFNACRRFINTVGTTAPFRPHRVDKQQRKNDAHKVSALTNCSSASTGMQTRAPKTSNVSSEIFMRVFCVCVETVLLVHSTHADW